MKIARQFSHPVVQATESGETFGRAQWLVALALTALAVALRITLAQHAGGLWRDEANGVNLATMPDLADVWNMNHFDSAPILWFLVLRSWTAVAGAANDSGLRLLGLLVGLSVLGALWLNARKLVGFSLPLVSLALVGLNPEIIRSGDSMRAYGPGTLAILLACGLLWHAMQSPTPRRVALAVFGSVMAVQTLFQNALLLFAIGVSCMIVAARRGHWRRALMVAGVGSAAALTLLPYMDTANRLHQWDMILRVPLTTVRLWSVFSAVLGAAGPFMVVVWIALAVSAIAAAALAQVRRFSPALSDDQRDLALFGGATLVLGIAAYIACLKLMNSATQPWHYITLATISAMAIDATLSVFMGVPRMKAARIGVVGLVTILSFQGSWRAVQVRQTNIDLIAANLGTTASLDDLIIITNWETGISFSRYYRGGTPWVTIPPLESSKLHRYDLVKARMSSPAPMKPVIDAMTRTLRSGHRVWNVGGLPLFSPGQKPPTLPPPPLPDTGWLVEPYQESWVGQAGYFRQLHATVATATSFGELVNPYEDPELEVAEGWRQP